MRGSVKPTVVQRLSIPLMLISGTAATVIQKFMMEQRTKGRDIYPVHSFGKPWYLTMVMFVAEVLALIFYQISIRLQSKAPENAIYGNLVEGRDATPARAPPSRLRLYLMLGLPALCDLVGSALMGIGLLYIDASIWQMLRGALTIFSALLNAFALKRKQRSCMWFGVMIIII
jgi:drug/metabolite transporter (DMT)-like permease